MSSTGALQRLDEQITLLLAGRGGVPATAGAFNHATDVLLNEHRPERYFEGDDAWMRPVEDAIEKWLARMPLDLAAQVMAASDIVGDADALAAYDSDEELAELAGGAA